MTANASPSHAPASEDALRMEKALDQIEKIISDRIQELKSWVKLAQINQDRKRELEILPILGENQALREQIKELRAQQTKECEP